MLEIASSAFGVVAIGRNEGDRLEQCLSSASKAASIVYVDSGSTDDSVAWAKHAGVDVIVLDHRLPFTAARARNAGFKRLREIAPDLSYVQFVDGDCELNTDWPPHAVAFLDRHEEVCAVFGRRRERFPERSIYNRLCDLEWNVPVGEVRSCGGDVMMRVDAMKISGGYRDDLIAGEEPELCVRLRALGWHIWRLDFEMTLHDANLIHFHQWWRRNVRSGYAFAQGAHLHGASPERHWVWESRRAFLWGICLPVPCLILGLVYWPWGFLGFLIFPLQMLRRFRKAPGRVTSRIQFVFFELLTRFAEAYGQLKFIRDRVARRQGRIIEYK